jgi:hypothetical protein
VVSFEPAPDLKFPLELLRGDVVIENHSPDPITIGTAEKKPILGLAHFKLFTLAEPAHGESVQEGTRVVRMPREFRIAPGATHRLPVEIKIPPHMGGEVLVQRWSMGGALRPITVRVGKSLVTRGVPWVKNHGVLLPEDLTDVAAAPLAHVRQALLTGDRRRFLAASTIWWQEIEEDGKRRTKEVRERMIDDLLPVLGEFDGALDFPAIRMLEHLTDEVRERSVRSWRIWGLTRKQQESREEP